MSARQDLITKHIADISALNKHILEAVERQRGDAGFMASTEANTVIIEIERVLRAHQSSLDSLAQAYGAEGEGWAKQLVTAAAGVAAGLYDKVRESEVTRNLRDDYTALGLASMGYTAMHAFALAVGEPRMAEVALQHLKDLTPLQVQISKVIPVTTVAELAKGAEGEFAVDASKVSEAVENTQQAWKV